MVREIIINDMWLGDNEERIIRIVSDGEYDEDKINESVDDLMKFFFNSVSSGFLTALTYRLNIRHVEDTVYKP